MKEEIGKGRPALGHKRLVVHIDGDLVDRVKKEAEEESRTVSLHVERIFKMYFASQK